MLNTRDLAFLQVAVYKNWLSPKNAKSLLAEKSSSLSRGEEKSLAQLAVEKGYMAEEKVKEVQSILHRGYGYCTHCRAIYSVHFSSCHRCGRKLAKMEKIEEEHSFFAPHWEEVDRPPLLYKAKPFQFVVTGLLGKGGFSRVYEVRESFSGRRLALKVLRQDVALEEVVKKRFLREILLLSHLDHPNIVPLYSGGYLEDGRLYYAMKVIPEGTLKELLSLWREKVQKMPIVPPWREWVEVFLRVCDGVRYAHAVGVIHRDLKPSNVALGKFGEVFVLDWGIAKGESIRNEEIQSIFQEKLTSQRRIMGTPGYIAPEMLQGEEASQKTDIFALGVILYEVLTLEVPFGGKSSYEKLVATLEKEPLPPHRLRPSWGIPKSLSLAAMTALKKDPRKRFSSVEEFQKAVRSSLEELVCVQKGENERSYSGVSFLAGLLLGGVLVFLLSFFF